MLAPVRQLEVWQLAHKLAKQVYRLTVDFPRREQYEIVSQLRRASVSVPTNIIEGNARGRRQDYARFCRVARGSSLEAQYLLELSAELGFLPEEQLRPVIDDYDRVAAMLHVLTSRLGAKRWDKD